MMVVHPPLCFTCTLFRPFNMDHPTAYCAAFEDGIPKEILEQAFDHRKPFPGDNGIRYHPAVHDETK